MRRFTTETFLFEIFFHFSPIKTFPFGLILMEHISVFQMNDPKSMNFFLMSESFALAVIYGTLITEYLANEHVGFKYLSGMIVIIGRQ